ncbi:MAG: hypothetical protein ACM3MG_04465 [Bacillota bacterium]
MTQKPKWPPLIFPWNGIVPTADTILIRDIDVVGVGSLRRSQLEGLQSKKEIILQTHASFIPPAVRAIYDEELLRTLQWLRPLKEQATHEFDFLKAQKELFEKIFPRTKALLGLAAEKICSEYLQEMEWSSWLLQDHWRYLSGFIRLKFPENLELKELVHWEWVLAWLEIQPFVSVYKEELGTIVLNPSLQIVRLTNYHSALGKPEGLYAFVYDPMRMQITERRLDMYEVAFLDLLGEERKYSEEQLLDTVLLLEEISMKLSKSGWRSKLTSLIDSNLLLRV